MSLTAGTRLGPYEVVAPIGAGGMGEVVRARDTRLDRDVAIKVLPESFASDPDRRARFEREAKAVAALSHPNILAVYDTGVDDDRPFVVTELWTPIRRWARKWPGAPHDSSSGSRITRPMSGWRTLRSADRPRSASALLGGLASPCRPSCVSKRETARRFVFSTCRGDRMYWRGGRLKGILVSSIVEPAQ